MMNVAKEKIVEDLRALGVSEGDHLNAKISLKAIGIVEGGAKAVIDALLEVVGPTGTIFTDAFVTAYDLPLSDEDKEKVARQDTKSYAGALANTMLAYPGAFRSPHPIQKFVGVGALAEELTQGHKVDSPAYGLLAKLSENGGRNLKIGDNRKVPGVGTTHVAIEQLGIKRERPRSGLMYENEAGEVEFFEMFWAGGCTEAWLKYYPEYEKIGAVIGDGLVGAGPAKYTDMKKTLDWEMAEIGGNPRSLLCGRKHCRTCALEWEFSDKKFLPWAFARLFDRIKNRS